MPEEVDGLDSAVRALSRLLLAEESLEATLGRVAGLACRTLPGCEMASVTMINDGRPSTAVVTNESVNRLDASQYVSDGGPCLEAWRTKKVMRVDLAGEDRWPSFRLAASDTKVQAVLCVPLIVGDQTVGVLNLYSTTPNGFTEADEETASLFSEQAAVACANAEVYWRTHSLTQHLREALDGRDMIGQAKGILMARRGVTSEAAFEALRRASMRRNVKVRDIADEVVYTGELLDSDFD